MRHISKSASLNLIDEIVISSIKWDKPIKRVGIDGKGVRKHKQVFSITNLSDKEIIGILPDLTQLELKNRLKEIDEKLRLAVEEVCIDMDRFFVAVIRECFPNAKIVIDHFHVIQWGIHQIKEQKKIIQDVTKEKYRINQLLMIPAHKLSEEDYEKLNKCFLKAPKLKESWKILHQLRKVYWQDNCKLAHRQLCHTIRLAKRSEIWEMRDLAKTLENWFVEILNYYISKTTNAYTEGIHTHFERIKRNHFGIRNIDRFCKRLLFCLLPISIFTEIFVQGL